MLLGVQCVNDYIGNIEFNAHRNYGYRRMAYISAGFEVVGKVSDCRMFILRKLLPGEGKPASADDFAAAPGLA